jgi:hypothetical protein
MIGKKKDLKIGKKETRHQRIGERKTMQEGLMQHH